MKTHLLDSPVTLQRKRHLFYADSANESYPVSVLPHDELVTDLGALLILKNFKGIRWRNVVSNSNKNNIK